MKYELWESGDCTKISADDDREAVERAVGIVEEWAEDWELFPGQDPYWVRAHLTGPEGRVADITFCGGDSDTLIYVWPEGSTVGIESGHYLAGGGPTLLSTQTFQDLGA